MLLRSAGVTWQMSLAHLLSRGLVLHFDVVLDSHRYGNGSRVVERMFEKEGVRD